MKNSIGILIEIAFNLYAFALGSMDILTMLILSTDLLPLWLNFFLVTLFFLIKLQMGLLSQLLFLIVSY